MIEKLKEHDIIDEKTGKVIGKIGCDLREIMDKLNELCDAVNKLETMAKNTNTVLESLVQENNFHEMQIDELQMKLEPEKCELPVDPYAEQQRWIGKLCKFWDYDDEEKWFSKLECIDKNSPYPYCASGDWWYKHCEPVKPDGDIIYKGE